MQIQCMVEDKEGFIWIGSTNGLYRLDAHGYTHYKANENDSFGLNENYITALFISSDNQLWIGTERKGVVLFDKSHNRFLTIRNETNNLNNISPSDFVEDKNGNIWFSNKGSTSALGFIEKQTHKLTYFTIPKNLVRGRGTNGLSISITTLGYLYLGTTDGLLLFNPLLKNFVHNYWQAIENFSEYTITQQFIEKDQTIWLSLYGFGLIHFIPSTGKFTKHALPIEASNGKINFCTYSKNEFLIFAGQKRLLIFDKQKATYRLLNEVNQNNGEKFGINHAIIRSKENIYYFGGSNGLFTLDTKNQPARLITIPGLIRNEEYKLNSILYNPFDSSYYAGLFNVNNFSVLKWHKQTLSKHTYGSISHHKLKQYINKLLYDNSGKVWCIDYKHLYYINSTTSSLVTYYQISDSYSQYITDFFIDSKNQIWIILSDSGLAKVTSNNSLEIVAHQLKVKQPSMGYAIVGQDKQNKIWISYYSGLSSFDPIAKVYENYQVGNPNDLIIAACIDHDNTLWINKYGKGIYHFFPKQKKEELFGEQDGLGSNLFSNYPIIISYNKLWTISTSYLSCLDLKTYKFQNYSGKDLHDLNVINPNNTFLISNENEFISATPKGIIICSIDQFNKANNEPHVIVNSIKVWGKDWLTNQDLNEVKSISLNHDQNYLTIGFSSLSFRQAEFNQFSYYLDGIDKEWHTSTNEKQITYTHLPSGTYTFNVKASNYAGVWDTYPKQIKIIIHPPFWQTWWFISSLIVLSALVVYLLVKGKIRRVRLAARLENKHSIELMEFELKALKAQINPHFLFNALSAIQQQIISQNTIDAHKYLGKFAKLLRSTLDLSDRRTIQLEDEVELLKNYLELEKVRFKNKFTFTIEIQDDLLSENPEIPGMIVQPYIENAIIHGLLNLDTGKEGLLNINFALGDRVIECTISDNGVGRKRAGEIRLSKGKTHVSKGIAITESRINLIAKLYNGKSKAQIIDLTDSFGKSTGTRVVLLIPIISSNE